MSIQPQDRLRYRQTHRSRWSLLLSLTLSLLISEARSAEAHPHHDQSDEALSEEHFAHHCGGYEEPSLTSAAAERASRARPKHGDIDCAERADTGY